MSYNGRRTVLKKLFSLPWIASFGGSVVSADVGRRHDSSGVLQEAEHKKLGTQLMRFLNTAELWNRQMTGKYEELSRLKESKAVSEMRTAVETRMAGLGDAFTRNLAWNEDEIVPGWRLRVILAPDKSGYLAVLVACTN